MKQKLYLFLILLGCVLPISSFAQILEETTEELTVDYSKGTINTRFIPPKGYSYVKEEPGSFGEFLVNFPLFPESFPIRTYKGVPFQQQKNHIALLKIDVGEKDLQQCADAWMRLYAEYQWSKKDYNSINFQFTSGQYMSWNEYRDGMRTIETGNKVRFVKMGLFDDSYVNFRKYLNLVFNYAGTISLERESTLITDNEDIRTGDFLLNAGSPGHSVFIVGVAKNEEGKKLYLLAESFMPAQDIHVIKNPYRKDVSPWYELDVKSKVIKTINYTFNPNRIRRFHSLIEKKTEPVKKDIKKK